MPMTIRTLTVAIVLAIMSGVTGTAWARDLNIEKCPKKAGEEEVLQQAPLDAGDDLIVNGVCTVRPGTTVQWGNVTITQGGFLQFDDNQNLPINFTAKSITIESGGTLVAGSATQAYGTNGAKLKLTFTGTPPAMCQMLDSHTDWCGKGILVKAGATLNLYGAKGVAESGVSWTHLRDAAGPIIAGAKVPGTGPTTLKLARDVTQGAGAWKKDDWIAVATTSFSPFETEFVQLAADPTRDTTSGGSDVTLVQAQALKYYHFGGPDPGPPGAANFRAAKELNYGVDERAEVGLITRSIKLTAAVDSANPHWGGEIKILEGFTEVVLQGVELEKFGKNRLGAYPIHLHMLGNVTKPLTVNANSVHHSFNKCVTVHSTRNVTIKNNVCARIVGHIFYQEIGNEEGISFEDNLGLGAMSNSFDIHGAAQPQPPERLSRADLIDKYWWAGDNLARQADFNYDGLNVRNTDAQDNPMHGSCASVDGLGALVGYPPPPCPGERNQNPPLYVEPASGFWIINPATTLKRNSIGGCQGIGVGYWYVAPADSADDALKFRPIGAFPNNVPHGTFENNRVHGCYSGVYNEALSSIAATGQFHPHHDAKKSGQPVIATLNGVTATRIRSRGIWLRPTWVVVTNARLATNRENVTLVTSGGNDGNAPGVWQLLKDSVLIGLSQNNVERFGPCFTQVGDRIGNPSSGKFGCIDQTLNPTLQQGGDETGRGYPDPTRNFFGYMLYDGPVLVFDTRFVNFNVNITQHLTQTDKDMLTEFNRGRFIPSIPATTNAFIYEGDAAFGWFQSNQSSYPTATASRGLIFENTDLIHQIYTEGVNIAEFKDGDKNTAIIDLDGTLTGYKVVDKNGGKVEGAHPISLNNLPFHHYGGTEGGSVDECHATGAQNRDYEGRPTSLMSSGSVGTLEFSALWPLGAAPDRDQPNSHWQVLTFTRDSLEFKGTTAEQRPDMALDSRNGLGIWEPKVTSGYGYTVSAAQMAAPPPPFCVCGSGPPCPNDPGNPTPPERPACVGEPLGAGIPPVIDVGVADVVKPNISPTNPFSVRLGICYTTEGNGHPKFTEGAEDKLFTISRGYKSYGQLDGNEKDEQLRLFWNKLRLRYPNQICHNLDDQQRTTSTAPSSNLDPVNGCPANGITALPDKTKPDGGCPLPSKKETWKDPEAPTVDVTGCVYPKPPDLVRVDDIAKLTKGGKPDLDVYFYDQDKGLLFFHVAQQEPNAVGPSPLGSCRDSAGDDKSCQKDESYYSCPAQGCTVYVVRLHDDNYKPIKSSCPLPPAQEPPTQELFLADAKTGALVSRVFNAGHDSKFPHWKAQTEPAVCK